MWWKGKSSSPPQPQPQPKPNVAPAAPLGAQNAAPSCPSHHSSSTTNPSSSTSTSLPLPRSTAVLSSSGDASAPAAASSSSGPSAAISSTPSSSLLTSDTSPVLSEATASIEHNLSSKSADRDKFEVGRGGQPAEIADDVKGRALEEWLRENGAKFPAMHLRQYEQEVRGVHASRDIDADEEVLSIPLKCLITVEMGKATDVGRAVVAADLDLDAPKHVYLMLYLLVDRARPDSFFRPYYDILPPSLRNMPIFWEQEELEWLRGSYLLNQIEDRLNAIEEDYSAICGVYPSFAEAASLRDFQWARMCVCSRNFGIIVNGTRTSALVPYADMLNHYRPRETKWTYDNAAGAFTITSLQSIAAGSQVYDSYGQKCNHRFLLNYGFAIENNVEPNGFCPNEVPVALQLDPADPLYSRKLSLWLRDRGSPGARIVRICVGDNDNTRAFLSLLRLICADEMELDLIEGGSGMVYRSAKDIRFPLSLPNEVRVLRTIMTLVQGMLNGYPSTLEEDDALLVSGQLPPFSNHRHATIQVRGEKAVLRHYLRMAEVSLHFASAAEVDREASLRDQHRLIIAYCNHVVAQIARQDKARGLGGNAGLVLGPGPTVV